MTGGVPTTLGAIARTAPGSTLTTTRTMVGNNTKGSSPQRRGRHTGVTIRSNARPRGLQPEAGETFDHADLLCRVEVVADLARPDRKADVDAILASALLSFGVIFIAEMGDKSQLMALTFATRFKVWPVIIGITSATALVHLVSVGVGYGLGASLPTGWISLIAALAFIAFGFWTLRGDQLTDEERDKVNRTKRSAVIAVGSAFFLAELGDKTMLATVALATDHGWLGVWIGSTLGMVVADVIAIVVGRALGKALPERFIRYGAAVLFFVFGIWLLVEAIRTLSA